MVGVLANQSLNYLVSGVAPHRIGNAHPNIVPYQTFVLRDGYVIIAVGNDGQFARLCEFLGVASLATDPRYATNAARVENRVQLIEKLSDLVSRYERSELLSALEERAFPPGPSIQWPMFSPIHRPSIVRCAWISTQPRLTAKQFRFRTYAPPSDSPTRSCRYDELPRASASITNEIPRGAGTRQHLTQPHIPRLAPIAASVASQGLLLPQRS